MRFFGATSGKSGDAIGCGLFAGKSRLVFARLQADVTPPRLEALHTIDYSAPEGYSAALREHLGGRGSGCRSFNLALCPDQYKLLQVDTPNVPPEEVAGALVWVIEDLVDFPVSEAVLDSFSVPELPGQADTHRLFVSVAPKSSIRQHVNWCQGTNGKLAHIDIGELCLRNLLAQDARLPEKFVFLSHAEQGAHLSFYVSGELAFARGLYSLGRWDPLQNKDAVVREIQRSLDYFEGNLVRESVESVVVLKRDDGVEVTEWLAGEFDSPLMEFSAEHCLDINCDTEGVDSFSLAVACGAALRPIA